MIAYILVLDAGIVGLSTFRKWRWFTLLGFAGSLAVYGLWYATLRPRWDGGCGPVVSDGHLPLLCCGDARCSTWSGGAPRN